VTNYATKKLRNSAQKRNLCFVLNTFVIALREGLEASLIVGILIAYLKKSERTNLLKSLWFGVYSAIGTALLFGGALALTSTNLSAEGEIWFAGTAGIVSVSLVTWMVFWMKKTARFMKLELEKKASQAISAGALSLAAFTAVAREGLETSLFLYANFKSGGNALGSTTGLILGVGASVALGYGIYKGAIRINLANFFKFSGIALILVAARVFKLSLGEFEELGFIDHLTVNVISLAYLVTVLPLYLSKPKPFTPAEAAKKIALTK
jgi:high-affinity iron transporter